MNDGTREHSCGSCKFRYSDNIILSRSSSQSDCTSSSQLLLDFHVWNIILLHGPSLHFEEDSHALLTFQKPRVQ